MLALSGHCSVRFTHELSLYQLKSIWNAFSKRTVGRQEVIKVKTSPFSAHSVYLLCK